MAGKNRTDRAARAADEVVALIAAVKDHKGALKILTDLRAAVEDRQRTLSAEIDRAEDRREMRLRAIAGETALRLLLRGTDEERAWMHARLPPALDRADAGDGPRGAAWLEGRWARRAAAEAALEEARAARRKRAVRAAGDNPAGLPAADAVEARTRGAAVLLPGAPGNLTADPAGERAGTADGGGAVRVAGVEFPAPPDEGVRTQLRAAGLAWVKAENRWRPKAPGTTVAITAPSASAFRAAGGVILEA